MWLCPFPSQSYLSLFTRRLVPPLGVTLATVMVSMVRWGVMVSASTGAVLVRQHMGHLQSRHIAKILYLEITNRTWSFDMERRIQDDPMNFYAPVSLLSWWTSSRSYYPPSYCARCSPSRRPPCHCRRQVETNVYHESSEIKRGLESDWYTLCCKEQLIIADMRIRHHKSLWHSCA